MKNSKIFHLGFFGKKSEEIAVLSKQTAGRPEKNPIIKTLRANEDLSHLLLLAKKEAGNCEVAVCLNSQAVDAISKDLSELYEIRNGRSEEFVRA